METNPCNKTGGSPSSSSALASAVRTLIALLASMVCSVPS